MEQFCFKFWSDYFDKVNELVSVEEMKNKYSVKNRRVYDLLGILDGLSLVQKLKRKGKYMWMGLNNRFYKFHFDAKKSISLKDISGLLKLLLNNNKKGLSMK